MIPPASEQPRWPAFPARGVAPVGIAVAAGGAIGIVVREALRARARTASEAHASAGVQVEVEAAASSPSAGTRLRPLAHALGLALLGIGVMLGVSALAALPLCA